MDDVCSIVRAPGVACGGRFERVDIPSMASTFAPGLVGLERCNRCGVPRFPVAPAQAAPLRVNVRAVGG